LRLIRQLLTESLLLALAGGTLGLLLAFLGSHFLLALVSSGRTLVSLNLAVDTRMLGFTAIVSLLSGIFFGLAPALRSTRLDPVPALNDSGSRTTGNQSLGLGKALIAVQVALSLLLSVVAGLSVRTLKKLENLDTGFNREHVLVFSTDPRLIGYQGNQIASLYQQLLDRLAAVPGVHSASLSRQGLLSGGATYGNVFVLGPHLHADQDLDEPDPSSVLEQPNLSYVGPRFFETSGIAMVRGRDIGPQDTAQAPKVAVVNEAFAHYYFGDENPIGRNVIGGVAGGEMEIVGLARDARYRDLRDQPPRILYIPYLQAPSSWRETNFQIRTVGDPNSMTAAVRKAVQEVNGNLPLYNIKTLTAQVDETLVQERLIGMLSSFFGLLSLLLAGIGLYGILAYTVNLRTQEIGTRMALGASRSQVVMMVLRQGMTLVMIGICLGLATSLAATRAIASQLYGISAIDPFTFACVTFLFLLVAFLACLGPSRRASRLEPMIALRCE
jgi:predicted permease